MPQPFSLSKDFPEKIIAISSLGFDMASQQYQNLVPAQIFPESIQVLAIDANLVSLRIHKALLEKCKYKVITITDTRGALHLLRQPENKIDLVLSHVVRHDNMDGLKLLETISSEMDIPVVLVSARDDLDYVVKGLRHGARDYLTKPVRLGDIKKLWYHVFKKTTGTPGKPCIPKTIIVKEEEEKPCKDQKKEESETTNTLNKGASSSQSKTRISWTPDLHAKFLDAIDKLGTKTKICPVDILEQMNVPGLTRQNIASHLQKYRQNFSKSEDENTKPEENVLTEDEDKTMQVAQNNPKPEENISAPNTRKRIHRQQELALPPSQHKPVVQPSLQQLVSVPSIQPSHIFCQGQTVHDQRKQNLRSASAFNLLNNPIVQQALRLQDFGYGANPSHLSFQQSDSQSYFPNYSYSSPNSFSSASHLIEAASPQMGVFSQHDLATMPPLQNFPLSGQHGGQHAIDFIQQPVNFVQSGGDSNMRGNLIDCTNNMQAPAAPTYMPENDQTRFSQFNQEKFRLNGGLLCQNSFSDSDLNGRFGLNGSLLRQTSFSDSDLNEKFCLNGGLLRQNSYSEFDLNEKFCLNGGLLSQNSYSEFDLNELLRQFNN